MGTRFCIGIFAQGVHYVSGAIEEFRGCRHEDLFETVSLHFGDTHARIMDWPDKSVIVGVQAVT